MSRIILHCDLNGFFASVECLFNPELNNVPMAVAGNEEDRRGIILAKNELAKKYNIKTAETIWQAKKKCPSLVIVPPRKGEYSKFSKLANEIYNNYTDLVEPFGIDESWLDVTNVTHIFGSGEEIAFQIREEIKSTLGLSVSVGVSFNKIFAKLGSDYKKPDATTVISRDNYKQIVYPLAVSDLLFVGKSVNQTLFSMNIFTIGDLANSDFDLIKLRLGKVGEMVWKYANGLDDSPVKSAIEEREAKSIGTGITFKRNLVGLEDILSGVNALADELSGRLRKSKVKCLTIQVVIKDPNFNSISRQKTLKSPTHLIKEIRDETISIITSSWDLKKPIRMLTITGANLVDENFKQEQLSLFDNSLDKKKEKQERIENLVFDLRDKFGKNSITLGKSKIDDIGV